MGVEAAASLVGATAGTGKDQEAGTGAGFFQGKANSKVGAVARALQDLASQSLLQSLDEKADGEDHEEAKNNTCYRMHDHVRSAVMTQAVLSVQEKVLVKRRYVQHYVNKLSELNTMYKSKASATALFQFDAERYAYDRAFALLEEMREETSWAVEEVKWLAERQYLFDC